MKRNLSLLWTFLFVGALVLAGMVGGMWAKWIGFAALIFATINVVGGFMVTDRMLEMFKKKD